MIRWLGVVVVAAAGLLLGSAALTAPVLPPVDLPETLAPVLPVAPLKPAKPQPPTVPQALAGGVLIVVSIPNQRAYVFKDGELWDSATVSTGKRGHSTPVGVFPILQKSKAHRSTLYNDAPMPYMQRLTWGGVALHGGNVTRARASHGCIRLPHDFARRLFGITSFRSTAVLITREPLPSAGTALALAGGFGAPAALPAAPARIELAAREVPAPRALPALIDNRVQTIQLAAAPTPENANALWAALVQRQPELGALQHQVIPAVVRSQQYYRLRATGPGAGALCRRIASSGGACFQVGRDA
jgi:hypothetical protein